MNNISMPMWKNGSKILLLQILQRLDIPRGIDWTLYDISAVGDGILGKSMLDLEELAISSADGVHISDVNLISLADNLKDLDRIELVGRLNGKIVIKLICFDSSTWSVDYDQEVIGAPAKWLKGEA